jgi:hypothetical protein
VPGASLRKVVYVLSSPHSGSTVFGMALAGHPEIVFGGELFEVPDPAWTPGRECSCGQTLETCPFWSSVRARYEPTVQDRPPAVGRRYKWDKWGWRGFPRVVLALHFPSLRPTRYAHDVHSLAASISEVAGRPILVDTSKDGTRALAYLLGSPDHCEVQFIHLTRDPRNVVLSRIQREVRTSTDGSVGPVPSLRYSALWAFANVAFALLFAPRDGSYLRVRYEDFVGDPEATLRRVGAFLRVDLSPVTAQILRGDPFPTGHVISGNRLRLGGGVTVRRERVQAPVTLPRRQGQVVAWVAGWAARIYGYR